MKLEVGSANHDSLLRSKEVFLFGFVPFRDHVLYDHDNVRNDVRDHEVMYANKMNFKYEIFELPQG